MRKLLRIVASVFLMLGFMIPAFADAAEYIVDQCDLLSVSEAAALDQMAARVSEEYECGVYVRIMETYEGKSGIEEYSEYLFDVEGLGYGSDRSMIMLCVVMEDHTVQLDAYGKGNSYFTDSDKEWILNNIVGYMSNGNWYQAVSTYIDNCETMLSTPLNTNEPYPTIEPEPVDNSKYPLGDRYFLTHILTGLFGGGIISLISCSAAKGKMKNTGVRKSAATYVSAVNITEAHEQFYNRTRVVTQIPRNDDTHHSRGSGTIHSGGTHISSSGHSHSSARKF